MALTDLYLQEFNKAAEKLTGVDYDPIAVLGIRVVMGIDTFVLCKATPVAQEQDSYYAIVTYYKYDDMYSITAIDPVG